MKANYSYLVLEYNIPNQQTTFCLTKLHMTLQITKGKKYKSEKTGRLVSYSFEFE